MKIFVICGKHPLKSSGGYATYTYALCKSLIELGHDVNTIAISDNNHIEESEIGRIHNVTSMFLPKKSSTTLTSTFFLWSHILDSSLRDLIENEKGKCVIYGIGPWGYAGIRARQKFKEKVKLVNVFFTAFPHESYWLMKGSDVKDYGLISKIKYSLIYLYARIILSVFEKASVIKSDRVLVHYDSAKNWLVTEYNVNPQMISKYPYYTEIYSKNSLYTKYDVSFTSTIKHDNTSKKFTCVSICRQEPRKGINYFLHALKKLKTKNVSIHAIVVGSGDLLEKNIELAKKLQIDDMVEFTGFVPQVLDILNRADVFVQPSLQEGSGSLSILEAFLSGVPVITTNCDGLPEDIQHGFNGLLIPRMNSQAISDSILNLYNDRELSKKLAENAKKMVMEKFNKKNMIRGLEELHDELW